MQNKINTEEEKGMVFSIQRFSVHDGPGIRTLVFLKGCPLSCIWCSNPESQGYEPEILFRAERCIGCGECMRVCPNKTADMLQNPAKHKLPSCSKCEACVIACNALALRYVGNEMTAREVFAEIEKDRLFYKNSMGGITLSGGEPLMQPHFALEILRLSKSAGFSTAIETSGYASWEAFETVMPYLDLILFDIKHMNDAEHIKLTGVSNKLIQENLERLAASKHRVIARFPLIPDCNDSDENVRDTALRVTSLGIKQLDLLPYHELGRSKYEGLQREYQLTQKPLTDERVQNIKETLESYGLEVQIGG